MQPWTVLLNRWQRKISLTPKLIAHPQNKDVAVRSAVAWCSNPSCVTLRVSRNFCVAWRRGETHQPKKNQREGEETMSNREDYQLPPKEGFVLTHFLTVADVNRSAEFYVRILGGTVVRSGEPTIIQIANSWLIVNVGGGPTDDKPTVTLRPPVNPNEVSSFLNIRVADIRACYEEWRSRGAEFLTHGMRNEIVASKQKMPGDVSSS